MQLWKTRVVVLQGDFFFQYQNYMNADDIGKSGSFREMSMLSGAKKYFFFE